MYTLGLASRMSLAMVRRIIGGLTAASMLVSVCAPALAVQDGAAGSRIELDLSRRQIRVLRSNGQVLGPWPVAIGDPSTPTPTGEFAILTKTVNPVYVSHSSGQRGRSWLAHRVRSEIVTWPFIAMDAVNSESMGLPGLIGFRFVLPSALVVSGC